MHTGAYQRHGHLRLHSGERVPEHQLRPDCDYIDGELQERNHGERPHGVMQTLLAATFYASRKTWSIVPLVEQRVEVSASRYRIPDVCILRRSDPVEGTVRTAPLVCIEVLSPADTLSRLAERVEDFERMGVEHIWVVDPFRRRAYLASSSGFIEPTGAAFTIPGTPIRLDLTALFAEFDDMQTQG